MDPLGGLRGSSHISELGAETTKLTTNSTDSLPEITAKQLAEQKELGMKKAKDLQKIGATLFMVGVATTAFGGILAGPSMGASTFFIALGILLLAAGTITSSIGISQETELKKLNAKQAGIVTKALSEASTPKELSKTGNIVNKLPVIGPKLIAFHNLDGKSKAEKLQTLAPKLFMTGVTLIAFGGLLAGPTMGGSTLFVAIGILLIGTAVGSRIYSHTQEQKLEKIKEKSLEITRKDFTKVAALDLSVEKTEE